MGKLEKYLGVFESVFGLSAAEAETAVFKSTRQWDSVGHVNLMTNIEEAFDISLEPDDILDFRSFAMGKEILSKYGIAF